MGGFTSKPILYRRPQPIIQRIFKWGVIALLILSGATGASYYLLTSKFSGGEARAWLDREVQAATGRRLTIDGDVKIRLFPFPAVEVEGVSFSNAPWSETKTMFRAERVSGQISFTSIFKGRFVLAEVRIEGGALTLETDASGRNNWDFETVGTNSSVAPPSSVTALDQVHDVIASLLSITSLFDDLYIKGMSVRYIDAGVKEAQMINIAWIGLEATDQGQRLALNIGTNAPREGQSLHVEIYDGESFIGGNGSLGIAVALDAGNWRSQATGTLSPEQNATSVDVELSLNADRVSDLWSDVGAKISLPEWPASLEPMSLDIRTSMRGYLGRPSLESIVLKADGKRGSQIRFDGTIADVLETGSVDGQLTAKIGDPFRYAVTFFDDLSSLMSPNSKNLGPLELSGNLGGNLSALILQDGIATWGKHESVRASLQNLTIGAKALTMAAEVSVAIQDVPVVSRMFSALLPPTLVELSSAVDAITITANIETAVNGKLNAENLKVSIGEASPLKISLTGGVGDLLGRIDPDFRISVTAESAADIGQIADAFVPEEWKNVVFPFDRMEGEGALKRADKGELALSVASLQFGDPETVLVSFSGSISDIQSLHDMEVVAHLEAKDGVRFRSYLAKLMPAKVPLNRMPQLDKIELTVSVQRRNREITVKSLSLDSGGALPLSISGNGELSLDPSIQMRGSIVVDGPDVFALRNVIAETMATGDNGARFLEQSFPEAVTEFRIESGFSVSSGRLDISDFVVRQADSHLTANLHVLTNASGRPHATLSITDASLYLPAIDTLLSQVEAVEEVGDKLRIFPATRHDYQLLSDFDMVLTARGEIVGIDDPILNSFDLDAMLENGRLLLKSFQGVTTKGNISVVGDWNIAGEGSPDLNLDIDIDKISLGSLLHRTEIADWLRGAPMSGEIKGQLKGLSPSDLAASFTGQANLSVGSGEIDKSVIDWFGGDILSTLYSTMNPFAETIPHSQLQCAEARLVFMNGIAKFEKKIAVETKRVALLATGQINLGEESIDLSLASTPKEGFGPALGGAGSLLRLTGRLDDPKISLDTWGASKRVISVGTSMLTGGVSSLLETIFDRLTRETNLCNLVAGAPMVK